MMKTLVFAVTAWAGLLCAGEVASQGNGLTAPQGQLKTLEQVRQAAEKGLAEAQYELSLRYGRGGEVEQNFFESYAWARKAADQGYAPAQYLVGALLRLGYGTKPNIEEGIAWIRKAAEQRYGSAELALGRIYLSGEDVPRDPKVAFVWIEKAAMHRKDQDAQLLLGKMYAQGIGVDRDFLKARRWFDEAIKQEDGELASRARVAKAETELEEGYMHYRIVSACFQAKPVPAKGFLFPVAFSFEHDEVKRKLAAIERGTDLPPSSRELVWEESKESTLAVQRLLISTPLLDEVQLKDLAMTCLGALTSLKVVADRVTGVK